MKEKGRERGNEKIILGCHYRYWVEPFICLQSSLPLLSLKEGSEDQLNGAMNMVIYNSKSSFTMNEYL